jgi:hypothetical protein
VIVYNLHVESVVILPFETDPPPLVNPDAVLPCPVSFELFQTICGWDTQIVERDGTIQHPKFAQGNLLDVMRQLSGTPS